jgi:hypothetical protein
MQRSRRARTRPSRTLSPLSRCSPRWQSAGSARSRAVRCSVALLSCLPGWDSPLRCSYSGDRNEEAHTPTLRQAPCGGACTRASRTRNAARKGSRHETRSPGARPTAATVAAPHRSPSGKQMGPSSERNIGEWPSHSGPCAVLWRTMEDSCIYADIYRNSPPITHSWTT